jgi:hypothetical protein
MAGHLNMSVFVKNDSAENTYVCFVGSLSL